MYEVLNKWTSADTWPSDHWADEDRFFQALSRIVRKQAFQWTRVGDYVEQTYRAKYPAASDLREMEHFKKTYTELARVVRRYFEANNDLEKDAK